MLEAHKRSDAEELVERTANAAMGDLNAPLSEPTRRRVNRHVENLRDWFTEESVSTFRAVRRLMHYASSLAAASSPMARLFWDTVGEVMTYNGTRVSFAQYRRLVQLNQDKLAALWKRLTRDTAAYFAHEGRLYDAPRNESAEFNWTKDPRNRRYFRDGDLFMRQFDHFEALKEHFVRNLPGTDVAWWNMTNVGEWLSAYAEFHEQLLISVELNTAGPARGTELTAMAMVNLETAQRNVFILGDNFVLRRRYHKSQYRTGEDKTIPEALDAFTAECFVQDHGMLREFACHLARLYYPDDAAKQNAYETMLFVNEGKLFTTEKLSAALGKLTQEIFGEKWGVNDVRHIIIAFKRKRNPALFALHDTDQTIQSAQSGHTRQADLNYATSQDVWQGVQEDIVELYIAQAHMWQRSLHIVPGQRTESRTWRCFRVLTLTFFFLSCRRQGGQATGRRDVRAV